MSRDEDGSGHRPPKPTEAFRELRALIASVVEMYANLEGEAEGLRAENARLRAEIAALRPGTPPRVG